MNDFCDKDAGFDYIFTRMNAIYGASFVRNWEGIDADAIRQEWIKQLGIYLTYRPIMDYAIDCLDPDFPPSALKFKELCYKGPSIPKGDAIEYKPRLVPMPPEVKAKMDQLKAKWSV
jgi:hypothetical protein